MADNLIFPIGFDLQKAVEEASQNWDKTYAKRLEQAIAKRPVRIKLEFEKLEDVKKRLAELKIQPITKETRSAIRELAKELQVLAKALEQVQKFSKTTQLGQRNFTNDVQMEKLRQANERLEIQKRRVALAEQKHAEAMQRSTSKSKELGAELQKQEGYISRLVKRTAAYWSFHQVSTFLTRVRDVTAEFELQRVSLGAIIQDQQRANQLFGEIKSFALKSPVSILDLTKYTKQIAAYGVETEKLFDTTKMLTDVSVGLGTPLSQLALAFGQIRSSSVLRLAETRQLTEAGIPVLELLAKLLEKTYGRFVSTAEVMELISKRAISFEMVEQMFKDMTSAGGAFYNMQEKQGNTLFGLWAKLGDAASVMYDEIGNTSTINSGMKEAIRLLSDLMRNWRNVGLVVAESAAVFAIWKLQAVNAALVTNALTAAEVRALAVKKVHYKMQPAIIRGIIGETNARKLSIVIVRAHAAAVRASATSTNIFAKAWHSLKAAFLSNPFGIALTAIAALATYLMFADDKVKRFKEDLDSIKATGAAEATKNAYNFEQLAEKAVNAADGSMEQKDALDELQRTYKDMIPIQDLTIEKLKALKGNYDSLTQSIKEYVYQRNLQQQIDRIIEERTATMTRIEQKLRDELKEGVKYQVSDAVHTKDLGIDDNQISALFSRIKTEAKNTTKDVQTIIRESVDDIFGYLSQEDRNILYGMGYNKFAEDTDGWLNTLQSVIELQRIMDGEIENASTSMSQYTRYLGEYKKELDNITESVKKYRLVNTKGEAVERNTFLFEQGQHNFKIKQWANSIKTELEDAGVTIQEGIFNIVNKINESDPTKISTIDFTKLLPMLDTPDVKRLLGNSYETFKNYILSIQKLYNGLVPSDPVVQAVRNNMFAIGNATKGGMDVMKKHLWDGKGSIEDHLKTLKQSATTLESEIYKYSNYIKLFGTAGKTLLKMMGVDVDALSAEYDALNKQIAYVQQYVKEIEKGDKSTKSDPRLQILNDIANKMAQINKEYDDLLKKEGQTKALADTQRLFASSFADMQKVADKYKFKLPEFEVPQTIEDVQKWYDAIIKEINRLGIKNADKILIELGFKRDKSAIDKQQREIEAELKRLADRISRTKTAREFYEKILSQTGDVELAANVSLALYGETGEDLFYNTVKQIQEIFKSNNPKVKIDLSGVIDMANQRINYGELAKLYEQYQNVISESNHSTAENIIKEGQETAASNIATWEKELAKAKDYEEQRTDIINREAQRRAEIYKSNLPQEEKDRLVAQSQKKQDEDLAKINFEEFTKSEDYIKIFENLDNVATSSLKRLRAEMQALIDTNQNLSPENMKTLVKAMEDIDEQISGRGFGNDMVQSVNDYIASIKNLKIAKQELAKAEAVYESQEPRLDADIETAKAEKESADKDVVTAQQELLGIQTQMAALREQEIVDETQLAALQAQEIVAANALTAAELKQNQATTAVVNAEQAKAKAADKVKKAEQKVTNEQDKQKKSTTKFVKDLQKVASTADQLAGELSEIKDLLGISEDSAAGLVFDSAISSLQTMSTAINAAATAQAIFNAIAESNPYIAIAAGVLAVGSAIASWISGSKVRKANKEIERQQELLEQLEYTYGRLEKAADKVFGADFVANQKQQRKILLAQAEAYQKQYQAELSKGKKADEEKLKEYQEKYRDTMDAIADMEGQVAERMLGTDLTSAARDFANAWLEAYKEFGNTADAMSEKFHEMIQNMIVESLLAKVMERALEPAFKMIDNMEDEDFYSESFWKKVMSKAEQGAKDADHGAGVVMKWIEKMGYDMREMGSEYSGIAKEVSSASSEEINQLSAFVNTALYYVSPIPTISENVALIRQLMERGTTSTLPDTTAAGWTDWERQAMDNYKAIAANTASTVVECRRAADACEASVEKLRTIITSKGSVSGVNVFMKG